MPSNILKNLHKFESQGAYNAIDSSARSRMMDQKSLRTSPRPTSSCGALGGVRTRTGFPTVEHALIASQISLSFCEANVVVHFALEFVHHIRS